MAKDMETENHIIQLDSCPKTSFRKLPSSHTCLVIDHLLSQRFTLGCFFRDSLKQQSNYILYFLSHLHNGEE